MTITECDCKPIGQESSHAQRPGARHVHVTDERGVWHAIEAPSGLFRLQLLVPSALELEAEAALAQREAAHAAAQPKDRVSALEERIGVVEAAAATVKP